MRLRRGRIVKTHVNVPCKANILFGITTPLRRDLHKGNRLLRATRSIGGFECLLRRPSELAPKAFESASLKYIKGAGLTAGKVPASKA
ncbi:hypothetical protein GUJ93_ZPchr0005g15947 [Zizania palustris]|uniref:Uncharacterized protein n=1 Tax=Zizania palustris TaxID=103762 RepID=A0A8J5W0Y4_ZIZPA|nr:hypothetical protein GUJ93_ZPchr0005g15947 [Zizania palustris]